MRALRFTAGGAAGGPTRVDLDPFAIAAFVLETSPTPPTVYVVRAADLSHVRQLGDAIVDRGRKLKAKALADLLIGYSKVPVVAGSYSNAGQLRRSVRTFLGHAAQRGEHNLYIVGADARVFEDVWRTADEAADPSGAASSTAGTASGGASRRLLDLLTLGDVPPDLLRKYVGESPEAQLVRQLIMKAAAHDEPVLILGDTGTGKEVVARAIHDQSVRRAGTFTPVNCGAIPHGLFESEVFGHERGAFTGAFYRKDGLWKVADKGTLFLDEIADLGLDHQVKILRALQQGVIRPVGATGEIRVTARVVAATNRDLFALVQARQFREDLYYRLRSFLIHTPALRTHLDDIPLLAAFFWRSITRDEKETLPPDILAALKTRRWPGNARELKATLTNLYTLFGKDQLTVGHLKAVFDLERQPAVAGGAGMDEDFDFHRAECLRHLRRVVEVLRACRHALKPIIERQRTDARSAAGARTHLGRRLGELEVLCLHPLLFHSEVAFSMVDRLRMKLDRFAALLETGHKKARAYWTAEVDDDLTLALSALFDEVGRLMERP